MKRYLTKEQSKRLLALGIKDPDGCPYERDYEIDPTLTMEENHKRMKESDYIPIFNIYNLLEILPKVLYKDGIAYAYNLDMLWQEDMKRWLACYDAVGDNAGYVFEVELIDALYELLIHIIEVGYLKLN